MLSKPNVKEVMPKVGNRYQSVLALAKRAREIEEKRVREAEAKAVAIADRCIEDSVNIAAKEILEGKVYIKINGEYAVTPEAEMEKEIKEAQEEANSDKE